MVMELVAFCCGVVKGEVQNFWYRASFLCYLQCFRHFSLKIFWYFQMSVARLTVVRGHCQLIANTTKNSLSCVTVYPRQLIYNARLSKWKCVSFSRFDLHCRITRFCCWICHPSINFLLLYEMPGHGYREKRILNFQIHAHFLKLFPDWSKDIFFPGLPPSGMSPEHYAKEVVSRHPKRDTESSQQGLLEVKEWQLNSELLPAWLTFL